MSIDISWLPNVMEHHLDMVTTDYLVMETGIAFHEEGNSVRATLVHQWSSLDPDNRVLQWAVCHYRTNESVLQTESATVTLLIPDRDRDNRDDFVWCVPIDRVKWNKWHEISITFKTVTPKEHANMHYINRMEGKRVRTILMLPHGQQSDADVLAACAYLRLVKNMTCRMYVVRCTDDPPTGARMMERVIGTDPNLMDNIDEGDENAGKVVPNSDDGTFLSLIQYLPDDDELEAQAFINLLVNR